MSGKYSLKVKTHFDAAHYLLHYVGKCSRTHGHRWDVEVELVGSELEACNLLIDFSHVKDILKQCLEDLDHYVLNETLLEADVSAEFLAKLLYPRLVAYLESPAITLKALTIWESPECSVTYTERND